jgi:hypothetical protein
VLWCRESRCAALLQPAARRAVPRALGSAAPSFVWCRHGRLPRCRRRPLAPSRARDYRSLCTNAFAARRCVGRGGLRRTAAAPLDFKCVAVWGSAPRILDVALHCRVTAAVHRAALAPHHSSARVARAVGGCARRACVASPPPMCVVVGVACRHQPLPHTGVCARARAVCVKQRQIPRLWAFGNSGCVFRRAAPPRISFSSSQVWSRRMSRARVYADVNTRRPASYSDYESLNITWGCVTPTPPPPHAQTVCGCATPSLPVLRRCRRVAGVRCSCVCCVRACCRVCLCAGPASYARAGVFALCCLVKVLRRAA